MYWGYSIFVFYPVSPISTSLHTFFTHFHHIHSFSTLISPHHGGALDPRECSGYIALLPSFGPREGKDEVATSDFVPFVGDPRERRGYIALLPSFGPLRRQG